MTPHETSTNAVHPPMPANGPLGSSLSHSHSRAFLPGTLASQWDHLTGKLRHNSQWPAGFAPPASALVSSSTPMSAPDEPPAADAAQPLLTESVPTSPPADATSATGSLIGLNDAAAAYADVPDDGPSYSAPMPVYAQHPDGAALQPMRSLSSRGTSMQSSVPARTDPDHREGRKRYPKSKSSASRVPIGLVYPALMSQVARALKERIVVSERSKDGLRYKDAFDGQDAVDKLCHILRTKDRNLALLLGRSLDAQKFFHDVTYDHRLRDSPVEMYQFRVRLAPAGAPQLSYPSDEGNTITPDAEHTLTGSEAPTLLAAVATAPAPATATNQTPAPGSNSTANPPRTATLRSTTTVATESSSLPTPAGEAEWDSGRRVRAVQTTKSEGSDAAPVSPHSAEEDDFPSGVFTLLTECYSPTCTPERLCYSITCPRRWEQQARLKKGEGALAQPDRAPATLPALGLVAQGGTSPVRPPAGAATSATAAAAMAAQAIEDDTDKVPGALWADSIPAEVLAAVPERERKRQERLNEVVVTEHNFVHDLEYLRDEWMIPLRNRADVLPAARRDEFVTQLFWNIEEILHVNERLCEALVVRQKRAHVIDRIGDLFLAFVPRFEPFVRYGAHQLYGKYEFEREKASNSAFARFVDETERRPAARKLELNGYLTKPVTRLARYPLLLQEVFKYTPNDSTDKEDLPKVIDMIKGFLSKVNAETGKSANTFHLAQLDQQLIFKPGEAVDLRLRDPMRELAFKGGLKRRAGPQSESSELQVFLFDHALLLTKPKTVNKQEFYKVTRKVRRSHRPLPCELF